jgi:hypothetical protein
VRVTGLVVLRWVASIPSEWVLFIFLIVFIIVVVISTGVITGSGVIVLVVGVGELLYYGGEHLDQWGVITSNLFLNHHR